MTESSVQPSFCLYSLTVNRPNALTQSIIGHFSGTKAQQLLLASHTELSLYVVDSKNGRLKRLACCDAFGTISSISSFKLTGFEKDYVIITGDAGNITVVEYSPEKKKFKRLICEPFGKSGIRRTVPGQYLAVDPKGRACMIASSEKNKLVYVFDRDSETKIIISSPLEANCPQTIVFDIKSLDVGFENPMFASIEIDYGYKKSNSEHTKMLTIYELDLGLNHIVRRWTHPIPQSSHKLIPIPKRGDGLPAVLVCLEGFIIYQRVKSTEAFVCPIPSRKSANTTPSLIISHVLHKLKNSYFFLLQNEDGDLLKLSLTFAEESMDLTSMSIKYFDSIPPARALTIFRSGFLFALGENTSHCLYQFLSLGEDDNRPCFDAMHFTNSNNLTLDLSMKDAVLIPEDLSNLELADTLQSIAPIIATKLLNFSAGENQEQQQQQQIYAICGQGSESKLTKMAKGLKFMEIVSAELPAMPIKIFTCKLEKTNVYDSYIILSFDNATLVLTIGETVEEVTDSEFDADLLTLCVQQMGEDAIVQITPKSMRHIRSDKKYNEWHPPADTHIVHCAANNTQIAIALSDANLVYFELDDDNQLNEYEDHKKFQSSIAALGIAAPQEGRKYSPVLTVACEDCTVRVLSLNHDSMLDNLSVQALSAPANEINMTFNNENLYLHIGLQNGVYIRTLVDSFNGNLKDARTRFIGTSPVSLSTVHIENEPSVLALSNSSWLSYTQGDSFKILPILDSPMSCSWSFNSEQCSPGIVGITNGNLLRILQIDNLDTEIQTDSLSLKNSPKSFILHPSYPLMYIAESPYLNGVNIQNKDTKGKETETCIQIVNGETFEIIDTFALDQLDQCHTMTLVSFLKSGLHQPYIAISGTYHGLNYIDLYKISADGTQMSLNHRTNVDFPVRALAPFHGRLLAGVGNKLTIYDIGQKQLLRKCEAQTDSGIAKLETQGLRIVVGDIQNSITSFVYKYQDNSLTPFVDDYVNRWTTSITLLDYDTVAGGDKFGNVFVLRCPQRASDESDQNPDSVSLRHEAGYLNGTPNRFEQIAHYYINDIIVSFEKTTMVNGGREILFYAGLCGTMGFFSPLVSLDEVEFFRQLESLMRSEDISLIGRNHRMYRSYYVPVKNVIDGDLCEEFLNLPYDRKEALAQELERSVLEVCKKIEDLRAKNF